MTTQDYGILFDKLLKDNEDEMGFIATVFGKIYEDAIKPWFEVNGYKLLGRPSVYLNGKYDHKTYDFTIQKGNTVLIVEAKAWLNYENGKYLFLDMKNIKAFYEQFNDFLKNLDLHIKGLEIKADGELIDSKRNNIKKALAVWDFNENEKSRIINEFNLIFKKGKSIAEIFSIKRMIFELRNSHNSIYNNFIKEKKNIILKLFHELSAEGVKA